MESTIKCGKHLAERVDISGSRFHNVNMAGVEFDDVNLSKASFHNINLSDLSVTAVQMGGAKFKHVGLPPGSKEKQRPLSFEEADLSGSTICRCDLSNVCITHCEMAGLTIDGLPVAVLLAHYKREREHGEPTPRANTAS